MTDLKRRMVGLAIAALVTGLIVGPASADHPSSAVTPSVLAGNQSCANAIPGQFELERKIEPVADGTYSFSNDISGTITLDVDEGAKTFDFSIEGAVALSVLVKGGPNTNWYDYRPEGVASDVDLHAPRQPNGNLYGLSHVTFCLGPAAPPATGAIAIDKSAKHAGDGSPNLVATFEIVDSSGSVHEVTTDADGSGCVDGLALGMTQSITETGTPAGYSAPEIANVEVSEGDCEGETGDPVLVEVENVPLTDLLVRVTSQHPGGTMSTIECDGSDSGDFSDPAELTVENLEPGTYTCEIVIDP